MKWLIIYAAMAYIVSCADATDDGQHTARQKVARAIFFPLTLHSWFRSQNGRLHRLLTLLWIVLISGWLISLMIDRLP